MKNILKISTVMLFAGILATSCIKEVEPQSGIASEDQVYNAPGIFDILVETCYSTLTGEFTYAGKSSARPTDFGYPAFMLQWDCMGQDLIPEENWFYVWYEGHYSLGPTYANCQMPWTYYYKWINNCNTAIKAAGAEPADDRKAGAGKALAMRAMFYMDLARMFQLTYVGHEDSPTVPIVTEQTVAYDNNPRATNRDMWEFILSDLKKAEEYLADYKNPDPLTPGLSFTYGLLARAYLTIENFPEAEKYAKLAQNGYTPLSGDEYTDHYKAFNEANHSWIFGTYFTPEDDNILANDSDSNWGSQMFLEVYEMGYASNYGDPKRMDAHLYTTIPDTDIRKKCYLDPALDDKYDIEAIASGEDKTGLANLRNELAPYTDYADRVISSVNASTTKRFAGISLKFRAGGGKEGRESSYIACCVDVPMMRVEEMMLIEAEAVGMQAGREAEGKTLLENFAKLRDPNYKYDSMTTFRDQVWWQRRVELWGEGVSTFDIKRLNKGIIRSYKGTNHLPNYRWNIETVPSWMNLCIIQTETFYNEGITENNPTPTTPDGDSPEHVW